MPTLRRFVAPTIGWALILVLLVPMGQRFVALYFVFPSSAYRCVAEVKKSHRIPEQKPVMMLVTPWDGHVTRASFKFLEEETGKTWHCECVFDENGKFISASAVEVK